MDFILANFICHDIDEYLILQTNYFITIHYEL